MIILDYLRPVPIDGFPAELAFVKLHWIFLELSQVPTGEERLDGLQFLLANRLQYDLLFVHSLIHQHIGVLGVIHFLVPVIRRNTCTAVTLVLNGIFELADTTIVEHNPLVIASN